MTENDSLLTPELMLVVRTKYMEGKNYEEIRALLDIKKNTWDTWFYKDYKQFRSNLQKWKQEYMVRTAELFSTKLMKIDAVDKRGKNDTQMLKIQQKEAEFIRETLGKNDGYSKRTETTGADGQPLALSIDQAIAEKHNLHVTDTGTEEDSTEQQEI